MRFCLALHPGTFLVDAIAAQQRADAIAAQQRADKSSATAEPELDEVNVPEHRDKHYLLHISPNTDSINLMEQSFPISQNA